MCIRDSLCSITELIAINQYGYGNSPPWSNDQQMTLSDQANAAFTILNQHQPFHLVGHSHGASIAAVFASMYPKYIKSLTLYEPNTFGVLDRTNEADNTAYQETLQAFQGAISHNGSDEELAERLLEYWIGSGAWIRTDERTKKQLIAFIPATVHDVKAAMESVVDLTPLRQLTSSVHIMYDPYTPQPALQVTRRYIQLLPDAVISTFDHATHLGPITQAHIVNQAIIQHINQLSNTNM